MIDEHITAKPNKKGQNFTRKDLNLAMIFFAISGLILIYGISGSVPKLTPHIFGEKFEWASAILGIWIALVIFLWSRYTQKFDPFEPPTWISINVYLQVILNVWLLQRDRIPGIPWLNSQLATIMPYTVLLFSIGLTVLWVGYVLFFRKLYPIRKRLQKKSGNINIVAAFLIWLFGFLFSVYASVTGIGTFLGVYTVSGFAWENYFFFINILENTALAALVIYIIRNQSLFGWFWFTFVILSELIISLINGSKGFALSMLWIVIYIYYARQKLSRRWVLIGALVIVLLVPVVNDFRVVLRSINLGSGVGITQRFDALITAISSVTDQPINNLITSTTDTFKNRQGSIMDVTASVLSLHPEYIPYSGREMLQWFFPQLIPRLFWPTKPTERPSILNITTTYYGTQQEYSFSEIGLFADSYRAGGWIIVVVWFLISSVFLAWLYLQGPGSENLAGIVFYIVMITQIFRYDGDITTTVLRLLQFGPLLWLVIFKVIYSKPPHSKNN